MERGDIRVEDVPDPTPAAGEVVVKSVACGICGSDLHAARHTEEFVATSIEAGGAFKLTTFDPVVLGHEFCAEVMESHGELRAGDLVCSVPVLARPTRVPVGYSTEAPGGFGEYMLLSERLLMPVPAGTSQERAALAEPMAVGYHAVNMARLTGGEAIVVIGAGPVGLAVTANLKARGAGPVAVSELSRHPRPGGANSPSRWAPTWWSIRGRIAPTACVMSRCETPWWSSSASAYPA